MIQNIVSVTASIADMKTASITKNSAFSVFKTTQSYDKIL